MLSYIASISLFSILYAYIGYPIALLLFKNMVQKKSGAGSEPKTFSIIIAARNEKDNIRKKLDDTLSLEWSDGKSVGEVLIGSNELEVIVADDASDDGTSEIVEEYSSRGIKLSKSQVRGGKEVAQKFAVDNSKGEIIIFTDTKVSLSRDILIKAKGYFQDSGIGALSSVDRVEDHSGESGEGAYVKYEMWVRQLESEVNSLVGLSGSCFLVRREVALGMSDKLASDFYSATECVRLGMRSLLANDIVGTYKAVTDSNREFERKVRTVLRGMGAVVAQPEVFDAPTYKFFTFQVISHKIYRWLVPWFFVLLYLVTLILKSSSCFWGLVFWGQTFVLGAAVLGYFKPDTRKYFLVRLPFFFVLSNAAILVASTRLLSGETITVWNPSNKG